jgi:cytochrome c oxidase subunit 2
MIHIHQFERYWMITVGIVMGGFMAALVASVLVYGVRLPTPVGRVDPTHLENTDLATPGLTQDSEHAYTLRVVAQMWQFDFGVKGQMPKITLQHGSSLKIVATSKDVTHGFYVEQHNVNMMLVPGQISEMDVVFNKPGIYHIICHEYCGPGHQNMIAVIEVL